MPRPQVRPFCWRAGGVVGPFSRQVMGVGIWREPPSILPSVPISRNPKC